VFLRLLALDYHTALVGSVFLRLLALDYHTALVGSVFLRLLALDYHTAKQHHLQLASSITGSDTCMTAEAGCCMDQGGPSNDATS